MVFRTRSRRVLLVGLALLGGWSMSVSARAEFKPVQLIAVTPDAKGDRPAEIFVSMSRDGWAEAGRPLKRIAAGVYSVTLDLEPGLTVEYKFTRTGSWSTVERAADGQDIPNRVLQVDPNAEEQVLVHAIGSWADRPPSGQRRVRISVPGEAAPAELPSTLSGDIRFHYLFHSPQLKNARTVLVYLPPGYDEHPKDRFPVLYMHDGNNVFDAKTSFTGVEWRADETAQRLIESGDIGPLIIVAVYNNADRADEYTPWPDAHYDAGGKGDAYLEFLTDTLKPFIDQTYRTLPDREHTGIAGSSLGGLISLYAGLKRPDVFGRLGVISPALFWADRRAIRMAAETELPASTRIWIDIGTQEGGAGKAGAFSQAVDDCRSLVKSLIARGAKPEEQFHLDVVEGGHHHESDWALRFDRVLVYLFGTRPDTKSTTKPAGG